MRHWREREREREREVEKKKRFDDSSSLQFVYYSNISAIEEEEKKPSKISEIKTRLYNKRTVQEQTEKKTRKRQKRCLNKTVANKLRYLKF